jgi:hypothetical protein
VFYYAIEEGQGPIVSYFLDNGIRFCRLALHKAFGDQVYTTVFRAFLDQDGDINDEKPGEGMSGLIAHPLGFEVYYLEKDNPQSYEETERCLMPARKKPRHAQYIHYQYTTRRIALRGQAKRSATRRR